LGKPDIVNAALPLNPLFGATVMVSVTLVPGTTLTVEVERVIEKFAGGITVKAIAAVAIKLPDFPVIVTLAAPTVALALAVNVSVLAAAVLAGLNDAVTPVGRPETVNATIPLNPFAGKMAILAAAPPPSNTLTPVGVDRRLKDGAPVTCRLSQALAVRLPATPCTVIE
jgi:hypothetical protein